MIRVGRAALDAGLEAPAVHLVEARDARVVLRDDHDLREVGRVRRDPDHGEEAPGQVDDGAAARLGGRLVHAEQRVEARREAARPIAPRGLERQKPALARLAAAARRFRDPEREGHEHGAADREEPDVGRERQEDLRDLLPEAVVVLFYQQAQADVAQEGAREPRHGRAPDGHVVERPVDVGRAEFRDIVLRAAVLRRLERRRVALAAPAPVARRRVQRVREARVRRDGVDHVDEEARPLGRVRDRREVRREHVDVLAVAVVDARDLQVDARQVRADGASARGERGDEEGASMHGFTTGRHRSYCSAHECSTSSAKICKQNIRCCCCRQHRSCSPASIPIRSRRVR